MFLALSQNRFSAIFGRAQIPKSQGVSGLGEGVTCINVRFNWLLLYEDLAFGIEHVLLRDPTQIAEAQLFLEILLFLHPSPLCEHLTSLLASN